MRSGILPIVIFLFLSLFAGAQQKDTTHQKTFAREAYHRYMKQRKTFNTLGWVALGAGVTLCLTSYASYASNDFNGTWDLEPLFIAGLVTTGMSLPLFITAGVFKRKAKLALKGENVWPELPHLPRAYPSLAFQIRL